VGSRSTDKKYTKILFCQRAACGRGRLGAFRGLGDAVGDVAALLEDGGRAGLGGTPSSPFGHLLPPRSRDDPTPWRPPPTVTNQPRGGDMQAWGGCRCRVVSRPRVWAGRDTPPPPSATCSHSRSRSGRDIVQNFTPTDPKRLGKGSSTHLPLGQRMGSPGEPNPPPF